MRRSVSGTAFPGRTGAASGGKTPYQYAVYYKKAASTSYTTVQGYSTVTRESGHINLTNAKAKYALYPVWILNTSWNNNKYTFAMNGQTGKFVGDLPIDNGAAARWFIGVSAVTAAACYLIAKLLGYA